jgi:hypothetical protein
VAKSAPQVKYVVPRGKWGFVELARSANGKFEAEIFFRDFVHVFGKKNGKKVQDQFLAICKDISDHGWSRRMSPERGEIHGIKWEFSKKLIRFGCFLNGKCWVVTHGFFKPGAQKGLGSWPTEQLDRADRIMAEHKRAQRQR